MKIICTVLLLALAAGCPADDTCGPGDAPGDGMLLSGSGVEVRYHQAIGAVNNDCPDPAAPEGVISLTISMTQVSGADQITLCVGRPDRLTETLTLGTDVEVVDVGGESGGCILSRNTTTPASGTVRADGICENGTDPAGFALEIQGQVSVDRDCSGSVDTLRLDLVGLISVGPDPSI